MIEAIFYVNEHKLPWKEGLVVQDALSMMNYTFKMLVIKLNGDLVKRMLIQPIRRSNSEST
jgi:sulfur carrier protein ThiS